MSLASCLIRCTGRRRHNPRPYFCCCRSERQSLGAPRPLQIRASGFRRSPSAPTQVANAAIEDRDSGALTEASTPTIKGCATAAEEDHRTADQTWFKVVDVLTVVREWLANKMLVFRRPVSKRPFTLHESGSEETLVNTNIEFGKKGKKGRNQGAGSLV